MDLNLERGVIRFMAVLFPQTRTGSEGELWEAEGVLNEMCIINMSTVMSSNNESDQWEFGKAFLQSEAQGMLKPSIGPETSHWAQLTPFPVLYIINMLRVSVLAYLVWSYHSVYSLPDSALVCMCLPFIPSPLQSGFQDHAVKVSAESSSRLTKDVSLLLDSS